MLAGYNTGCPKTLWGDAGVGLPGRQSAVTCHSRGPRAQHHRQSIIPESPTRIIHPPPNRENRAVSDNGLPWSSHRRGYTTTLGPPQNKLTMARPSLQGRPLILTVSVLTSLGFMLIGYDNGLMGGLGESTLLSRNVLIVTAVTSKHARL